MGTVRLPTHSLTIDDVNGYAHKLNIPNYIGCFMIDELPSTPQINECGIFNLEPSSLQGSHWVCWYKNTDSRIYFDSFGETPPPEIIQYLKTKKEIQQSKLVIQQSFVTVQKDKAKECGSLCLFVIYHLSQEHSFESILDVLQRRYSLKSPYPLSLVPQ